LDSVKLLSVPSVSLGWQRQAERLSRLASVGLAFSLSGLLPRVVSYWEPSELAQSMTF
jgi:hypothetical protein